MLALCVTQRTGGVEVLAIADRDHTGAETVLGSWNRACAVTLPPSQVRPRDLIVRVDGITATKELLRGGPELLLIVARSFPCYA